MGAAVFSPLHLLDHYALWPKVLLQVPISSDALIHWRVQVMYFYSWGGETANYELVKRERWLSFVPIWCNWYHFCFNWQHNRSNVQIVRCVQCSVECRMYDSAWVSKRQAAQNYTLSVMFNTDFRAVATTDLWVSCHIGREICRTKEMELIYGRVNIDVCSLPTPAAKKLVCKLNKNNATWLWQFVMLGRIIVDLKLALLV